MIAKGDVKGVMEVFQRSALTSNFQDVLGYNKSEMDLFDHAMHERMKTEAPLAARMRPRTLDEFVGQEEVLQAA